PTGARTRRRRAATARAGFIGQCVRDFCGTGRRLVEGEPQGHVPCALEFTGERMRATRPENPGHQPGRVGKFPMVFISLGSPIEKVASFRNASCICKKLLCSNKTNVTHRHARSTRNGAGAPGKTPDLTKALNPSPVREILIAPASLHSLWASSRTGNFPG